MTIRKVILFAFVVIVFLLLAYGFALVRHGFSAKDQPSLLEKLVAHAVRDMAIPSVAKEQKNPWGAEPPSQIIAAGRAHWADHCAICHGNDGSGATLIGQNLYPKAPDMRLPATQNLSDGDLYYIIVNGVRLTGMPAWGLAGSGKEDENWHLVSFIRHLPKLSPGELDEMRTLNPKTEADRLEEQQEEEFLKGAEPSGARAGQGHKH